MGLQHDPRREGRLVLMKPSLARYALAIALLGTLSGAFIGITLMRHGTPAHLPGRVLWWVLAAVGGAQLGPALGFVWSRGALQQGLLPLWSRGTKRGFTNVIEKMEVGPRHTRPLRGWRV